MSKQLEERMGAEVYQPRQRTKIDISKCKFGKRLIFTHQNGKQEECEFMFKGQVSACVVVRLFDKDVRTSSHDGIITLPIRQLSEKKNVKA